MEKTMKKCNRKNIRGHQTTLSISNLNDENIQTTDSFLTKLVKSPKLLGFRYSYFELKQNASMADSIQLHLQYLNHCQNH